LIIVIFQYITERVSEEEQIRGSVNFIDHIPRNDAGKLARYELAKILEKYVKQN